VLVLGTVLLALKGAGLAMEARAEEQQGVSIPAEPQRAAEAPDPAADDAETSSAQVDVLTSLAKRRTELDARERDLDMRDNLIAAAEKRVDGKIDNLKQLQSQIQVLLTQRDAAEQKQLDALVKTYTSMKPKDAARIFDSLNDEVLLAVASQMKPDVLGAILSGMQSEAAQKLTVKLANRLKLPETPPAQVAMATPPVAAPAPPTGAPQAVAAPQVAPATAPAAAPTPGKAPTPTASGK
jgi:flagellar motility protein MotE (MotC chaperone)